MFQFITVFCTYILITQIRSSDIQLRRGHTILKKTCIVLTLQSLQSEYMIGKEFRDIFQILWPSQNISTLTVHFQFSMFMFENNYLCIILLNHSCKKPSVNLKTLSVNYTFQKTSF